MDIKHKKQLLLSIIKYLQSILNDENLVKNQSEFENALKFLQSSTGLSVESSTVEPINLESIFQSHIKLLSDESPEFEEKFSKYVSLLEKRGYFSNVSKGSPQYEELLQKARNRFIEKYGSTFKKSEDQTTTSERKQEVKDKVEKLTIEVEQEEVKVEDVKDESVNNDMSGTTTTTSSSIPLPSLGIEDLISDETLDTLRTVITEDPQVLDFSRRLFQSSDFHNLAQSMLQNPNLMSTIENIFKRQGGKE